MTHPLLTLAARVEALSGRARWIDGDIAHALALFPDGFIRWDNESIMSGIRWQDGNKCWDAPAYTASVDATMTLAPALMPWSTYDDRRGSSGAVVSTLTADGKHIKDEIRCRAATPALALTAAALKARASMESGHE